MDATIAKVDAVTTIITMMTAADAVTTIITMRTAADAVTAITNRQRPHSILSPLFPLFIQN